MTTTLLFTQLPFPDSYESEDVITLDENCNKKSLQSDEGIRLP